MLLTSANVEALVANAASIDLQTSTETAVV
jgi:hypothetical protein